MVAARKWSECDLDYSSVFKFEAFAWIAVEGYFHESQVTNHKSLP